MDRRLEAVTLHRAWLLCTLHLNQYTSQTHHYLLLPCGYIPPRGNQEGKRNRKPKHPDAFVSPLKSREWNFFPLCDLFFSGLGNLQAMSFLLFSSEVPCSCLWTKVFLSRKSTRKHRHPCETVATFCRYREGKFCRKTDSCALKIIVPCRATTSPTQDCMENIELQCLSHGSQKLHRQFFIDVWRTFEHMKLLTMYFHNNFRPFCVVHFWKKWPVDDKWASKQLGVVFQMKCYSARDTAVHRFCDF